MLCRTYSCNALSIFLIGAQFKRVKNKVTPEEQLQKPSGEQVTKNRKRGSGGIVAYNFEAPGEYNITLKYVYIKSTMILTIS